MMGASRRSLLHSALVTGLLGGTVRRAQAAPAPILLRRGINVWPWFSLTREFPAPRTDYGDPPFQPQRPVPRLEDLARLRQIGLDFIRLPVDPGPFLAGDAMQRRALRASLLTAIASAIGAGLKVIVNLHANGATHHWNPERMLASTAAPAFPAYLALVAEMAGSLQLFASTDVALEPVNEPPQACSALEWTKVQEALLLVARRAAPSLTLVATGACGSMVQGLEAMDPTPLRHLAPLLYTFHFYDPYLFTHQGAPWMREPVYRALNAVSWPAAQGSLDQTLVAVRRAMDQDLTTSAADKATAYTQTSHALAQYYEANPDFRFIRHYLSQVERWAKTHAIPPSAIVLGEFGALRTDARYLAAAPADRARYIRDVRETAEALGLPWAFWNLFDGFGLMDDDSRVLDADIVAALGLAMP